MLRKISYAYDEISYRYAKFEYEHPGLYIKAAVVAATIVIIAAILFSPRT